MVLLVFSHVLMIGIFKINDMIVNVLGKRVDGIWRAEL